MVTNEELNGLPPLPYKIFEGRYYDAMPALREEGRIPMTLRQIAEKRLEVLISGDEDLIHIWWDTYFNTVDAIAYNKDEIKVIPNSQMLMNINPDAELKNGALVLTEEQYNNLEGKTFQRSELAVEEPLTKKQAKEHPVWQELLGDVLNEYVDAVFEVEKKRCGKYVKDPKLMIVYLANAENVPTLYPWFVGMVDSRSDLFGSYDLDYDSILVGILDKETN